MPSATYKALIIDDEPNARERIRALLRRHGSVDIAGECADGIEAVAAIRREHPDLILLDVQMPGLDGFGVLAHLIPREIPVTIFITAYDEHAIRAFDVGAADYVLKPIVPARFDTAVRRALERVAGPSSLAFAGLPPLLRAAETAAPWLDRLIVEKRGRMVVVPLSQVHWLESEGNYVRVHSANNDYLMRATLRMLESRLDPARFMRIHRSAIVSLRQVAAVRPGAHGDGNVVLRDGVTLPASRARARELRARLRQ